MMLYIDNLLLLDGEIVIEAFAGWRTAGWPGNSKASEHRLVEEAAMSRSAVLIDLESYRRRMQPPSLDQNASQRAMPMVWWPVWIYRPVWYLAGF
jgi:hypothetical protein